MKQGEKLFYFKIKIILRNKIKEIIIIKKEWIKKNQQEILLLWLI